MKVIRILPVLSAIMLSGIVQASEYFKGYGVNQPQVRKPSTPRALEYERTYNKEAKERLTSFYHRLKSMLGFQPAAQQMKNSKDTQDRVDVKKSAEPAQEIRIVKNENHLTVVFMALKNYWPKQVIKK